MKKLVSILIAALLLVSALPVSGALAEGESVTLSMLAPYFSSYDPADTPRAEGVYQEAERAAGL